MPTTIFPEHQIPEEPGPFAGVPDAESYVYKPPPCDYDRLARRFVGGEELTAEETGLLPWVIGHPAVSAVSGAAAKALREFARVFPGSDTFFNAQVYSFFYLPRPGGETGRAAARSMARRIRSLLPGYKGTDHR